MSGSYVYGRLGTTVEQISSGGTVSYLHHDQAGSTRLLTGSTGTVTGKCSYSAYGTSTCEGATTTPLGYDAQYTSTDTGLIYLRNRVYDPTTAQFLTADPLDAITHEPYSYAGDNPVNSGDPSGLSNWNPFSESFWTEGNVISESPLNPIPYYEKEIESYENGCGYFASVTHGLEGAVAGTALFAGGEGEDEAGEGSESLRTQLVTSSGMRRVILLRTRQRIERSSKAWLSRRTTSGPAAKGTFCTAKHFRTEPRFGRRCSMAPSPMGA